MKVIAFNSSPRKNGNTVTLLKKALDGATSKGAETELIHLYDYDYKGCISCFACKRKGGVKSKCAMKDGASPLLDKLAEADAVIFGSPVYFHNVTGMLRSFLERFWFCNLLYTKGPVRTAFPKEMKSLFIFTSNAPEQGLKDMKADDVLNSHARVTSMILRAPSKTYFSTETRQFDDYSKYDCDMFDVDARIKRHAEVFPVDGENCFALGAELIGE